MKLCRLIYKSIAYEKTLEPQSLDDILNTALTFNKKAGINGLLILSGDRFLQVLEGPPKFVNELYKNIVNDERHHDVELMHYDTISEASFSEWNMRLIELDKVSVPVYKMMLKKYPHTNKKITFPENKMLLHSLLLDTLYFANLSTEKQ